MHEIVDRDQPITREVWDRDRAVEFFNAHRREVQGRVDRRDSRRTRRSSLYRQGNLLDLCLGPHLPSTGKLGNAFKLTKVAGAYWRGDAQQRAAPARLRHGLGHRQGPEGLSPPARGSREARPSPARPRDGPLPSAGRGRRAWCSGIPRAGRSSARSRTTSAAGSRPPAMSRSKTPQLVDRTLWEASGHWEKFRENMFTICGRARTKRVLRAEADELPLPRADLQARACTAIASCRCAWPSSAPATATSRRARCTASCACAPSRRTTRTSSAPRTRSRPRRSRFCELLLTRLPRSRLRRRAR